MEEQFDRNNLITKAILKGFTLDEVARVFSLTRQRARQIMLRVIRKIDPVLAKKSLKEIRGYKNRLITAINNMERQYYATR